MSYSTENTSYLFIGGLFPKDHEAEILENSIGSVQNAANVLQWNFVDGFDQNLDKPITILNAVYIGSYPKRYKVKNIAPYHFSHAPGANDYEIGFCNLSVYKHFSRTKNVKKFLKRWLLENRDKKCVIFGYAMTTFILSAMEFAKKNHDNVINCLIVPDLPEYMNLGQRSSTLYSILKSWSIRKMNSQKKYVDKYVLLTDQMHDHLGVKDYIVVEGIASDKYDGIERTKTDEKTILYAGGLNVKYGILDLVDAFMLTNNPNYRLVICGSGNAESYITEAAKKDGRIEFKGQTPHYDVLKLQVSATVLVNPRKNTETFTKYSFPSKNLEYLSSGTPLIAYKLDGIPEEYADYIQYVSDDSIESLSRKLVEICEMDDTERIRLGLRAKEFALSRKNSKSQVARVLDFVNANQ